jgi:hypothetical protein
MKHTMCFPKHAWTHDTGVRVESLIDITCLMNEAHSVVTLHSKHTCFIKHAWRHATGLRGEKLLHGLNDEHVGCTSKRMKGTYQLRRKRKPKHRNVERNAFTSKWRHRQGKENATTTSRRAASRSSGSTPISQRVWYYIFHRHLIKNKCSITARGWYLPQRMSWQSGRLWVRHISITARGRYLRQRMSWQSGWLESVIFF